MKVVIEVLKVMKSMSFYQYLYPNHSSSVSSLNLIIRLVNIVKVQGIDDRHFLLDALQFLGSDHFYFHFHFHQIFLKNLAILLQSYDKLKDKVMSFCQIELLDYPILDPNYYSSFAHLLICDLNSFLSISKSSMNYLITTDLAIN